MKKNNSFLKSYKNLRVLITGTTGFKGAWLSFWLNKIGAKVIGIALKPEKNSILFKSLKLDKKIQQYYFDITNFKKLNEIIKLKKPDIIFHLAAQSSVVVSVENPSLDFEHNILQPIKLIQVLLKSSCKKLVFTSSGGTIFGEPSVIPTAEEDYADEPESPYGVAKKRSPCEFFQMDMETFLNNRIFFYLFEFLI